MALKTSCREDRQSAVFPDRPDGKIAKHYEKVDPAIHSKEVLADLKALGAGKPSG